MRMARLPPKTFCKFSTTITRKKRKGMPFLPTRSILMIKRRRKRVQRRTNRLRKKAVLPLPLFLLKSP
jgi:hypothetical protein